MKKILFLLVLMLIGITTQLTAQVNGTAARPLVSTAEKPVYYYIENQSATDGYTGNVLLPGTAVGEKLQHLPMPTDVESAKWQLVNESGTVKLKNKQTGYYMSGSHTYATTGDAFEVNKYEGFTYYKMRSGRQSPTLAHDGNLCNRQTTEIDRLHWYFIVTPESQANYEELLDELTASYYTDFGTYGRNDNARKLNSLSFTAAQNTTLTINQQTVYNTSAVYFDKTTQIIEVVPGSNLSVSFNWTGTWMRNIAYVDWNNDKTFSTADATERIGYNASAGGVEMTKPITYAVPADQAPGDYRMRIMVDWFANHSSPNEAKFELLGNGGSVVDVILRVLPAAPTLPFGTSNLIVKGDAFTLTPPAGATVKYTTDDTDPATSPTAVTGTSVTANGNFKLRAISVKDGVNSTELVRDIKTIDLTLGNEYYIVFQRTGNTVNPTLALKDMGDGVPMQTQTLQYGQTTQRWTVSKGTSDGLYKLTSIAGNIMYYNGSKFTVSASPAVDAEVDMRFITFSGTSGYTQYSGYEIQRKNSTTMGMNPIGGSAISKEIGEWNNGDGGNCLRIIPLPAYSGNALNMNGVNNYMRIPHNAAFNFSNTEEFSVTLWVNSTDLVAARNARIVAKRGDGSATNKTAYEMWGLNAAANYYAVNTTKGESDNTALFSKWSSISANANTWVHLAFTVSGTGTNRDIRMYMNGQLAGSSKVDAIDATNYAVSNAYDVFVGWGQYGGGYLKGKIDNLRFWSKGLNQSEVETDQSSVVNSSTPNLIAAYDFSTVDLNAMTVADIKSTHTAYLHNYDDLSVSNLQQFGMTGRGNTNDPILRATTVVNATDAIGQTITAPTLVSAILNLTGTTSLSDITSLKVYSTGTNVNFDPRDPITKGAVLLGSCSPAAGDITCTLSGTLATGTNYLWITTDIANNAAEGNQIDIALKSITYNTNKTHTLAANNPTGTTNIMLARKLIVAPGDAGSANYRIPAVITANDGSVILFTDKRKFNNTDLPEDIDVVAHRSTDKGKTWSAATTIAQGTGVGAGFGDVATVKTKTGKIIALFAGGTGFGTSTSSNPIKVYKSESTDNGISWSAPTDITSQLYAQGCTDPTRAAWSGLFIASGQMLYTSTGRIMAVALVRGDGSGTNNNYIVYSDDEGTTWTMSNSKVISSGDEAKIMELADGTFMVTSRKGGAAGRLKATSADGLTWTGTSSNISELVEPACNGDFVRYSKAGESTTGNILLHSIPNHASSRRNVSVFYSTDEGTSWTLGKSIVPEMAYNGLSAYSALTVLADGTIGAYVEVENYSGVYELVYMNFSLNWLTGGSQTFAENRWTGASSSDFNSAANWASGVVPTGETPAIILAGNAANPLVLSGTRSLGAITVNPGARLTIDSETVTATSITVVSDGTGTGTVMDNSNATNRTANVKTQLTGKTGETANDQWWYIATPVTGATSNAIKSNASNLFGYYDEATASYPQISNTTTELTKGTGYLVKLAGTSSYYTFAGTLNNGDISINLTRTGTTNAKRGFNLIGNPYPSYINWNTLLGSRTDIRPTIWYRSRTAGGQMVFDTWNGLAGTGAGKNGTVSQYIPPMQAFWVKVDKDGTTGVPVLNTVQLTFSNTVRSHRLSGNATSSLLRAPQQNELQLIRLQVSNGTNRDETILMASELASNGTDRYDAEKMQNNNTEIPEIAIWMNNTETAINAVNQFPLNTEIPLIFRPGKDGNFSLSATEIKTAEENIEFILKDSNGDTETILNNGDKYSFAAATTDMRNRFALVLRAKGTTTGETQFGLNPIKAFVSAQQRIIVENTQPGNNVQIFSTTGQLLESMTAKSQSTESTGHFTKGVYFVKVSNYVQKIIIH